MIKFVTSYGVEIEEIEIVKETEKSVWTEGSGGVLRRHSKRGWKQYHDTRVEAINHILKESWEKVERAKAVLASAERRYLEAKALVKK